MDIKEIELCIIRGFRLTEYQVFINNKFVDKYYNIRDEQGVIYGYNYDDVDTPLNILINFWFE